MGSVPPFYPHSCLRGPDLGSSPQGRRTFDNRLDYVPSRSGDVRRFQRMTFLSGQGTHSTTGVPIIIADLIDDGMTLSAQARLGRVC